jgi:lysophospholipase L1-like esterase
VITDPAATTVLCYGDSHTYGTGGDDYPEYVRLAANTRYPGRLQDVLGAGWSVIEEGLNGRTIDLDYADRPGLNGRTYLAPCLLSHTPLDFIVVMLGTNDCKAEFGLDVAGVAGQWDGFLDDLFAHAWTCDDRPPAVLLVSPAGLDATQPQFGDAVSFDDRSVEVSWGLAAAYARVAERRGVHFLDAGSVVQAGPDGYHLTAEGHDRLAVAIADRLRAYVHKGME